MIDKKMYQQVGLDEAFEGYKQSLTIDEDINEIYNSIEIKMKKPDLLGKTLRVTERQFTEIHGIVNKLADKLEMSSPDVFVFEDFFYGIESFGMNEYWIEISAKTIRDFSIKELEFLFAREMYKINYGVTYQSMLIEEYSKVYQSVPSIGGIINKVARNKFNHWYRLENYSADNFAYLYCKDLRASISAIVAMVLNSKILLDQVDMGTFVEQASDITKLDDMVYNYTKADEVIPYAPMRVESLLAYSISVRGMKARKEMEA
ncbi:M48 family metallopeptidase [Pseudobutyrivibrio xylanivorans]|uniref:M48 family metallopeptidase n=1 Tax=Pseudobutyrivibrio xylanivorans TaxID=185007 RepID=A0A5P6VU15_PSEXY|nr:M48 family metallopeptidase [Pseudobutyrivibrio xylanivorans]QFJ54341.1 M48 family metallopeptidase [Pseudobutyrivibrio xylanivorans]